MKEAIDETERRRALQVKYNTEHGITPQTVKKALRSTLESEVKSRRAVSEAIHINDEQLDQTEIIRLLEEEMLTAAKNLEFERAAQLRDKINEMKGAPVIKSANAFGSSDEAEDRVKIWQPKNKGKPNKRVAR
jgi:excinuclease ABC subunit B